jgi:hypothetical protein
MELRWGVNSHHLHLWTTFLQGATFSLDSVALMEISRPAGENAGLRDDAESSEIDLMASQ